ncbi:MAG TPA: retropepsin-like aspartic protease [Bacteroidales bacterium]
MLVKIPLELVELDNSSFHLFVAGFINGQKCNLIIDTGASKTVFALNHIQHILHEEPVSQPDIQSAGISASTIDSHSGLIRDFRMGNMIIRNMEIILIDLSSIDEIYHKFTDKSIWGLIGSDFLLKYKARLDYGNRLMTLNVSKSNILEK